MEKLFILSVFLLPVLSGARSCFIPDILFVEVPHTFQPGYRITKVDLSGCDPDAVRLDIADRRFYVRGDGEIVTATAVSVGAGGLTFTVRARGSDGQIEVHLGRKIEQEKQPEGLLRRSKRRWSPPPFNILENDLGPYPKDIERIVSDSSATFDVYYTFSGPGFNEHPVGVFTLNQDTGMLTVHKMVDREEFSSFTLTTNVFDKRTNQQTDKPLPVTIIVDDVNDNAPTFSGSMGFTVLEQSKPGANVGTVNATDRDQPGTDHVKIRFKLLSGLDLFSINSQTGVISTVASTLDRETKDKYTVVVEIRDMLGAPNGLSNTGTATITLGDINDNPPTFKEKSHAASVKENENEQLVLRIPVEDKDLINTPNWIAKFIITKGNENGNFRIDTDPVTNEGLLYVSKGLDYEKGENVKLEVMARNEAELTGTTAQWLSIPVDISVINVDEGPEFTAPTVRFTVKENIPNGTLIGSYTAVDPETKSSKGINYYKTTDPAAWINVDKNTGELRVANTIDRESHFVQDGIYNVTMKAVDASSKTGTGTVIIVVEDVNDNIPTVPISKLLLCEKEGELGSVPVVAQDNDRSPFSSPFTFNLPSNDGKWSLSTFNDTAATLKQMKDLPTGIHEVPIDITDLQGFGTTQTVKVRICQCRNGACLDKESSVSLGALALLAMLLPLALLLLLCILLVFFCVTKREKLELDDAGDSGGILIKSNTEAPGEEVDSSLITVPGLGLETGVKGSVKGSTVNAGWLGNKSASTIGGHSVHENGMYKSGIVTTDVHEYYSGQYDSQFGGQQFNGGHLVGSGVDFDSRYLTQNSGFLHTWQTNGRYLQQKLAFLGTEENGQCADDIIHAYGFEGVGSAAGSIGCCSDYDENDTLDFLNTLGPKFKTLADVCTKT